MVLHKRTSAPIEARVALLRHDTSQLRRRITPLPQPSPTAYYAAAASILLRRLAFLIRASHESVVSLQRLVLLLQRLDLSREFCNFAVS